ncbi:molybdopterin-dependent oxidoreductase [Novosphingobium sp. NBM11]|nr:molybdopterin-dependent oxidoreductase [Novosphingobium sp. NBM11]
MHLKCSFKRAISQVSGELEGEGIGKQRPDSDPDDKLLPALRGLLRDGGDGRGRPPGQADTRSRQSAHAGAYLRKRRSDHRHSQRSRPRAAALKRVGGPGEFAEISWDQALDDIATRLKAIIATHGPQAVATYFGNPGAFSTDTFMSSQWFLARIGSSKFYAQGHRTALRATSRAGFSMASPFATRSRTCRIAIS